MPQICMIQISVSDLKEAIDWYCHKLGFEMSSKNNHFPFSVDLVHEGCRLVLHKVLHPANIDYPRVSQTLICIATDDITSTMSSLQKKGVEFIDKVSRRSPAGLFAAFRDPFGNVHELIQPQK